MVTHTSDKTSVLRITHTLCSTRTKVYIIYSICLSLQLKTHIVNIAQWRGNSRESREWLSKYYLIWPKMVAETCRIEIAWQS
jgi:hypothetical protein